MVWVINRPCLSSREDHGRARGGGLSRWSNRRGRAFYLRLSRQWHPRGHQSANQSITVSNYRRHGAEGWLARGYMTSCASRLMRQITAFDTDSQSTTVWEGEQRGQEVWRFFPPAGDMTIRWGGRSRTLSVGDPLGKLPRLCRSLGNFFHTIFFFFPFFFLSPSSTSTKRGDILMNLLMLVSNFAYPSYLGVDIQHVNIR
ncbi:hypothetical protein B0I35DRAFT_81962 [Stachybotrys elegans]|uniref:Uncharacterized protein n=1 Tax=Stachybotrys elegans TaxID=80388 RepID=A0A8K0WLN9_9HYPO|nr:hypothetical protein B0I35DRAFT_81962 [Stachybotrys elegans]